MKKQYPTTEQIKNYRGKTKVFTDKIDITPTKHRFNNENPVITAENVQQIANAITIAALTTNYAKSGDKTIRALLYSAIDFAKNPHNATNGNGGDLIQDTILYLWGYQGYFLDDITNDGQTDKNGEFISIIRGAFRNIRKIIYKHEQKQYKHVYIDDYENENGVLSVPFLWDISDYTDYVETTEIIKNLDLNENQLYVLNKRIQGYSLSEIADTKNVSKQAIANTLEKIGKKYISVYGEIAVPTLEKILAK